MQWPQLGRDNLMSKKLPFEIAERKLAPVADAVFDQTHQSRGERSRRGWRDGKGKRGFWPRAAKPGCALSRIICDPYRDAG